MRLPITVGAFCLCFAQLASAQITVDSHQKLRDGDGGTSGPIWFTDFDPFSYPTATELGSSLANIGDFDGDGVVDLFAGNAGSSDGGTRAGGAQILLMNSDGTVKTQKEINGVVGRESIIGLPIGGLPFGDFSFAGQSVVSLGDINGDGTTDLAMGVTGEDDGGPSRGSIYTLRMRPDGIVDNYQKVAEGVGGFVGPLDDIGQFGFSMANVGDLDSDGIQDLVVGTRYGDGAGDQEGEIWVLFLNADGTVKAEQKIDAVSGGFSTSLDNGDRFGLGLANLGDIDGASNALTKTTIAVGAVGDDDGGPELGAVWLLGLKSDGTVASIQKISNTTAGFIGALTGLESFGSGIANIGDIDGNGTVDMAVSYSKDGDAIDLMQGFFVVRLNSSGGVVGYQRVAEGVGGYVGPNGNSDSWAGSLAGMGDLDGDGAVEIMTGNPGAGGARRGTLTLLEITATGMVTSESVISSDNQAPVSMTDYEEYGTSVALLGDVNGDGVRDIAVGAPGNDYKGSNRGSVWIQFMNPDGTVNGDRRITSDLTRVLQDDFYPMNDQDDFGYSVARLGNLDGLDAVDIIVGAPGDDTGGNARGAVWTVFLDSGGRAARYNKISDEDGGFTGALDNADEFGFSVSPVDDFNGDGIVDAAVGAPGDDDGGASRGAVWILHLNTDGSANGWKKISDTSGGFTGTLEDFHRFGSSVASIGDIDNDGVNDLAVGAPGDDDGVSGGGAVWILRMNANGTVKANQKLSMLAGGFDETLNFSSRLGTAVSGNGDLNGDGVEDIFAGAPGQAGSGLGSGAVFAIYLNPNGTAKGTTKIDATTGGFSGTLNFKDAFGSSVAVLGNISETGITDIVVGAPGDDEDGNDRGAVYSLLLEESIPSLTLELRGFVQGAYLGGSEMRSLSDIVENSFPLTQPFTDLPWKYEGLESLPELPNGITDWVLVELRDPSGLQVIARRAGLLTIKGNVVDLDGESPLSFENLSPGKYRIVLIQRNHLAIISPESVNLN